jgi:hypothetical protein
LTPVHTNRIEVPTAVNVPMNQWKNRREPETIFMILTPWIIPPEPDDVIFP